ncbi:MAG: hypothetical protein AAB846_02260, partial [Patescibacteria group bacterium]
MKEEKMVSGNPQKNEEVLARVKLAFLENRLVRFGAKRYHCIGSGSVSDMLTEVRRDIYFSRAVVWIESD